MGVFPPSMLEFLTGLILCRFVQITTATVSSRVQHVMLIQKTEFQIIPHRPALTFFLSSSSLMLSDGEW